MIEKRTRKPNQASSIYKGSDGYWHGRVTVGTKDDGSPDRRHRRGRTEAEVIRKVRALERERDTGAVPRPGRPWTVAKWLSHWVEEIAAPSVAESTADGYRVAVNVHLIPGIGRQLLPKLEPEHLERLYAKMRAAGSNPGNAHFVHRTVRAALNEAVRRGHLTRNPATIARPPRVPDAEIEPHSVEEVRRILEVAGESRNSARLAVALALGLRQGEALGLKWSDLDLEAGILRLRRNRLRPKYRHGCGGTCGRKAGYCPQRELARAVTGMTKSRAGVRRIGLPKPLVRLLQEHRQEQERERDAARQLWKGGDWVFATPTGGPLSPNTDYHHWKALLTRAGVKDARLHDARHTAATTLLLLGIPERAVMGIMGWSNPAMAKRYQHLTDAINLDIAERVGQLLWEAESDGDRNDPSSDGSAHDQH